MPDLRSGHTLQTSRAAGKHAGKVGRDGVVESGDAVGENAGDGSGEPMPAERTKERIERLFYHGGKRSRRMLHGGVPRVPCTHTPNRTLPPRRANIYTDRRKWP